MKFERRETINGKTVITASKRFLFWHKIIQYEAQEEHPKGYWVWLEMPNMTIVPTMFSFQLDAWNKLLRRPA